MQSLPGAGPLGQGCGRGVGRVRVSTLTLSGSFLSSVPVGLERNGFWGGFIHFKFAKWF